MTIEQRAYVGMDLDTSGGSIVTAIIAAIQEDNEGVMVEDYHGVQKSKSTWEDGIKTRNSRRTSWSRF